MLFENLPLERLHGIFLLALNHPQISIILAKNIQQWSVEKIIKMAFLYALLLPSQR